MATIKSYTDLSQSKTLSKILPLESADMVIWGRNLDAVSVNYAQKFMSGLEERKMNYLPCWSLAALLEEIPEIINFEDDENDYALEILKESGLYYLYYLSYGNPLDNGKLEIEAQENFVDACYELILKLHELNLL